jgi:adenylate cyclase
VQRKLNPANVPKCRPIEDYWGILKRKVYENDWSAKEIPQLIKRIKWAMTQVDSETCTRTYASVHRRLNTVARKGVDAL